MVKFSIVIPCYQSSATLPACLESLEGQTHGAFELILVDSTPGVDAVSPVAAAYPWAKCHHHPERLGAHAARNLAAQMATGELLAFMDPDMTAAPDWLAQLDAEQQRGHTVVGGGVDCPIGYWTQAVHLTKYGWWLSGGRLDTRSQLPSGNLCLPRRLFLEVGGFPDRFWEGDTALSDTLAARNITLWHQPAAVTVHNDVPSWRSFLRERYLRGYDTARARTQRNGWGKWQRGARTLASPLTWMLMLWRGARLAVRSGWGRRWLFASPVIGAGLLCWVVGESRANWEVD